MIRYIDDVIHSLPGRVGYDPLPAPEYRTMGPYGARVALATGANKDHMTDEAWSLFAGLPPGNDPVGFHIEWEGLDVADLLARRPEPWLTTVLLQDKREWEGLTAERRRDPAARFRNVEALAARPDAFKLTVLKDAHGDPDYHRRSAEEIGCHAWVVYYHPRIVSHLAPWTRPQHLVRTWHSLDATLVPPFAKREERRGTILSGALSRAYPLRSRLAQACRENQLPGVTLLPHPGYHQRGCETPKYLELLGKFRVAICTSSVYGYALRKIMEATACGCAVVTDLPVDETLPEIDGNLVRVPHDAEPRSLLPLLNALVSGWDADRQAVYAERAKRFYDYKAVGRRLAEDIENLRRSYNVVGTG